MIGMTAIDRFGTRFGEQVTTALADLIPF
jgi:hypothetical protein